MKYGGNKLTLVGAPKEVVNIIMGTIIFFIAIALLFKRLIKSAQEKKEAKKTVVVTEKED